ncbi:hypothetical protein BJ322DRAFT_642481 [Thelephora terrestris]|uniref:Uncharacterized protein n=1 Tax=Thelephora terrestris TaxID=56493 RepID=A0A9P6HL80_9AGAM|nr:hypothetical protein BJ322DRAFT_642481 [Thelephora terrestris]
MRFGWSVSKILFILIRYVSILLLFVSDFGYFYHGFSAATCSRYYMAAPVMKVIQIMISQVIIGYRTWAITRRSKEVGLSLLGFGFIVTVMQWYANVDGRIPVQEDGNCSPGNSRTRVPQWVFYLMAVLFDSTTCIISTFFLVRSAGGIKSMSALVRMLFYDGLGYMITLTGVNILNLILYRNSVGKSVQSSGASFGYLVVWIMSQRILIHIHEAAEDRAHQRIFVSHQISAPRDITQAMRNQFNNSAKEGAETTNDGLDVQVQIEEAVMVDYDPIYGREDYRTPRVLWDRKPGVTRGERTSEEQNEWELSSTKSVSKTTDTV